MATIRTIEYVNVMGVIGEPFAVKKDSEEEHKDDCVNFGVLVAENIVNLCPKTCGNSA